MTNEVQLLDEYPEKETIQRYSDIALWFDVYMAKDEWIQNGATRLIEILDTYMNLSSDEDDFYAYDNELRYAIRMYDHKEKTRIIMQQVENQVLNNVFGEERILKAKRYVDFSEVDINEDGFNGIRSILELVDKETFDKRRIALTKNNLLGKARRIKKALPNHLRTSLSDEKIIDMAYYVNLAHEMTHPIDQTVAIDNPEEGTFNKAKKIFPERFTCVSSKGSQVWEEILHRELFARSVEDHALTIYLSEELCLSDDELLQFRSNYYDDMWKKAQDFRFLLEYIHKIKGESYDFNEISLMQSKTSRILSRTKYSYFRLPLIEYYLPYMERAYDIDLVRDLAG